MSKVALIIIYNHQYNNNIKIIEQIYKNRFSNIYHLVPFYNGQISNVIAVYENSFYFQGYVAQGFKYFFKKYYEHYFFIADDLILNPIINENNFTEYLKLKQNTCFISKFITLHERKEWWSRIVEAFRYNIDVPGVEIKTKLPDYDTALKAFRNFKLEIKPLKFDQIWKSPNSIKEFKQIISQDNTYIFRKLEDLIFKKKYHLSYPMIGGYSDIFVINRGSIDKFCNYCGIFAATKLFVEIALPTSLVLAAQEIVTESELILQGKALWGHEQLKELDKFDWKLSNLFNDFPMDYLYLHPIKLSKWDTIL